MTSVACLGEVMVELSLDDLSPDTARVGFAGDTFNTAVYLKRAAPALDVAYVTKLGEDRLSARIVSLMDDEAIDTTLVLKSPDRMPGLYAINTDAAGERSFLYWRENAAVRTLFQPPALNLTDLARFDVLYLSAISLAVLPERDRRALLDWLPGYRAGGGRFAFDSNYRPRLWPDPGTARATIEQAWRATDIGLPSVDDEIALFGDGDADAVIARLNNWGVTSGALKCGAAGPRPLDGTTPPPCPQAPKVVDSTAAGDSFNAGYLAARLTGATGTDAYFAGHDLASLVVQHRGAIVDKSLMENAR
ncbi:MAG: sugar kinase [Boseongicola sp.]|nr:sugar kinase [Boseongicola sp.]